jgi:hypothetical protein
MKNTILTSALLSLFIPANAQIKVTGETFSKIDIEGVAKVIIKQDSACSVEYSGGDKPSDGFTSIKNGTLVIDGSPGNQLIVTMPVLKKIEIGGNGSVNGQSKFNTDDIELQVDGDGKITLDVEAKKVKASIAGFGKITLSGTADETDFSISGSGKIDALSLNTQRSNVNISGMGKCLVDVTDELNTDITGTGTVSYKTLPKTKNENITGTGSISKCADANEGIFVSNDTTVFNFGDSKVLFIGKKDSLHTKKHKAKPIWGGFEMGINSYVEPGGSFTLRPENSLYDLRPEKSISVGLNIIQHQIEIAHSNVWLFSGLGVTWNNYRFASDVVLVNGPVTTAYKDTSSNTNYLKSKLVAVYLTAPLMLEWFTSHDKKKAFHIGAGGMFGLRIGSHTKQKIEMDNDVSKLKNFDDFNLSTFRYGFRVAVGYGKFNVYADYYASPLFAKNKGPELYPVNVGITFIGF